MIETTYDFYTDSYGGTLVAEEDFNIVKTKAQLILDNMINADFYELDATKLSASLVMKVKMSVCALCDGLQEMFAEGVSKGVISSEKVGGWTTTYKVSEGSSAYSALYASVKQYLDGTELMCMWIV
jgi:hypothetical protein